MTPSPVLVISDEDIGEKVIPIFNTLVFTMRTNKKFWCTDVVQMTL